MNDRVAGVKPRHDVSRRIELDHASNISREGVHALHHQLKVRTAGRGNEVEFTTAETGHAGSTFGEDTPLLKSLADFQTANNLGDVSLGPARKACPGKEVS